MKKINQELFIAILDDDPDFAYVLSRMIEKVLGAGKVQVHIQTFRTTQEADTSPLSFDLLFLDVELGNENGIQWVKSGERPASFRTLLLLHPMIIMCLTVLRPVRLLI
jgi:response regulator of citrate/malate metabolism